MCLNDWRAGRLIRAVPHALLTNGGQALNLPPNPQRVGAMFSCTDSLGTFQGFLEVQTPDGLTFYFLVPASSAVVTITLATHGDLPTKGLLCSVVGAASTSGLVTEFLAPEAMLAAGLHDFDTEYGKAGY